jgi:Domain of unknown function (DUF3883)
MPTGQTGPLATAVPEAARPMPQPDLPPPNGDANDVGPPVEEMRDTEPPEGDSGAAPPPASGGYTPDDREAPLQALRKRRAELDSQERALLGVAPMPDDSEDVCDENALGSGTFRSDDAYRDATLAYERRAGRYPVAKASNQAGHDIDSYDEPPDSQIRRLVRRIEVKGRGSTWRDDETVEVSGTQFLDALVKKDDGMPIADDFDYWLYVVDRREDGTLEVIPIKNPAQRAAKFEFRGGTWRALAEEEQRPEN